MCSRERSAPPHDQRVRAHRLLCLLRLALWLTWHGIGQRQGTSESETAGKEIAAVHGRASWVRGKSSLRSYPDWTQPQLSDEGWYCRPTTSLGWEDEMGKSCVP